jgi:CheY-like chemotaxis protein
MAIAHHALIADDNADNRTICRLILEKSGFIVQEAVDGAEAISQLKLTHFALLLLDMQMPIADGRSVVKWIKAVPDCRPLNIVVLTANSHWVTDEVQSEVDFVMHKPIGPTEFTQFARRIASGLELSSR